MMKKAGLLRFSSQMTMRAVVQCYHVSSLPLQNGQGDASDDHIQDTTIDATACKLAPLNRVNGFKKKGKNATLHHVGGKQETDAILWLI